MKIGILLSSYNSKEYIDECLRPWINLVQKIQSWGDIKQTNNP